MGSALGELGAPLPYIKILKRLYAAQTAKVGGEKESRVFKIERGVKQGGPISPILFNTVVEVLMRRLKKKAKLSLSTTKEDFLPVKIGRIKHIKNWIRSAQDARYLKQKPYWPMCKHASFSGNKVKSRE